MISVKEAYWTERRRAKKAEVELVEAVKDKVKAESEVRRLRERIRKLWGERSEEESSPWNGWEDA